MACLLDTGVLLRLIDQGDSLHGVVEHSVDALIHRGEALFATVQNIAELWNVATRPLSDNGLGLAPEVVAGRIDHAIEPILDVLSEHERDYSELKRLLLTYNVRGKQVHDARLAASMITWGIDRILTLNERHFLRFAPEGLATLGSGSVSSPRGQPRGLVRRLPAGRLGGPRRDRCKRTHYPTLTPA